ncbi:glycosyltransferase family 2 protein [Rivibacter subsaxonicus]|uniref:Glycosyl transferase family 2 n=1 Tax=Rivibacter subsaxonicus TaxID=457575 RepID=A0A4Q7VVS6_9BURK|nr:glycosyltransferase family A protein [Rivibacter subsaxonicus]RZU00784.1 glycosyl transferase family 2 [Rivibacter subsaxonicus]
MAPYVIVTPVRDEESFIARTVASVLGQTHRPLRWLIVDDGSTDRTAQIVREMMGGVDWIDVVSTGSTRRRLGSAEVEAFSLGLAALDPELDYEFVVKLDGDVELEPDYFERVVGRMQADPRWGIASGVYCEEHQGRWEPVSMPTYHAAGASKVVRRRCFEQIGGFVARKGWDTVDEIRAGLLGWRTGHFDDIRFRHLKPEGAAMGSLSTHRFHGEIYYQTGGGPMFLLAKVAHRACTAKPYLLGGAAMLTGYLVPLVARRQRLVSDAEARYYRSMLNRRLLGGRTRAQEPS